MFLPSIDVLSIYTPNFTSVTPIVLLILPPSESERKFCIFATLHTKNCVFVQILLPLFQDPNVYSPDVVAVSPICASTIESIAQGCHPVAS
jgi:hypothetical protein